ncbi:MAG: SAM-dependent methyltransferase, partial [Deltaproteobacteria bacterium]|nr:SAM-dependent methyltransferase [Deltaproteobacteria bacterium]
QSPKKKYGIWIFHEKLNKDSLFRIRKEYVEPKINLTESRIRELQVKRDGAEGRERRALEKEIGKLVEVLDDVREFLKRLTFVIEERGYVPHIDDGVLLNMAPLWELIPSWQKEPKKAWEALERGDYDWAYQAMDHWPDRVEEKCRTNKFFAIAHGLA